MRKYELSLSKDYVPNWTVVDAVRELFQNALDQETSVKGNQMFFSYDKDNQILHVGNKLSILNVNTLLLGSSTKRNDPNTIGQFGEGYKVATLVLSRLGKRVVFYNYGAKEVWMPRFVKAKRYGGSEILTFFVDTKYFWQRVPDNNLTIAIEGITSLEYQDIIDSNLHLQNLGKVTQSEYGQILHDEKFKGKVFVNGLFICNYNKYDYGYNFKPKYIKIDRDRKLADSFELEWLSSKMWSGVDNKETIELVKKGSADVAYITSAAPSWYEKGQNKVSEIADKTHDEFKREHGEHAIPVTNQDEYEKVNASRDYKPVFVKESYCSVIKSSTKYEPPIFKIKKIKTTKSKLEDWLKAQNKNLSRRAKTKLRKIIGEMTE
ncbi:hypothetical protein GCM10023310_69180 [Paenibacillus vulneris]|uniref:ATP-binding protein n=1 Tax=Paenibacillus vulneris TaxID=1133364 RepID=A0ABW3UG21_9BACL